MWNRLPFILIVFSLLSSPCFAESYNDVRGIYSEKEIKTGPDMNNDFVAVDLTQNSDVASSPQFSANTGTSSVNYEAEDMIFGYGSKHEITFKKDGRIINSKGEEIADDKEFLDQLRKVVYGYC